MSDFARAIEVPGGGAGGVPVLVRRASGSRTVVRSIVGVAVLTAAVVGGWFVFRPMADGTSPNQAAIDNVPTTPGAATVVGDDVAPSDSSGAGGAARGDSAAPEASQPLTPVRPAPPPPARSMLLIQLEGGWARIFLDGVMYAEESRGFRDSLTVGRHVLRFERTGYVTIDTTVTLEAGETRTLRIRMREEGSGSSPLSH